MPSESIIKAARTCRHCGAPAYRIHRNAADKLLNTIIAVSRYQCSNKECRANQLKIAKKPQKNQPLNLYAYLFRNKTYSALLFILLLLLSYFALHELLNSSFFIDAVGT